MLYSDLCIFHPIITCSSDKLKEEYLRVLKQSNMLKRVSKKIIFWTRDKKMLVIFNIFTLFTLI